ncbi:MAG: sulfite exporter TauE/SafE family protein [Candidatus Margulisiibacteriota bacterium]
MNSDSLIIFFTCIIATLLSSMSGGGANIINMPIFLALGVPFRLAVTMMLVNSAFWVLPASHNYLKDKKINWSFLLIFSAIGLIGAYLGVIFVTQIEQRTFEIAFGGIILCLVLFTYFNKGLGLTERQVFSRLRRMIAYPFALFLGFYETIFGAGNGIIFTILTFYTRGFDFIDALGHYYAIAFPWAVFSAYLLIKQGYFDVRLMAVAVIGSLVGAVIGSRYARYKGNHFIKTLFIIVGGILGLKLLLGF